MNQKSVHEEQMKESRALEREIRRLREESERLIQSEEKYRTLVNEMRDGLFTTDRNGTITFANSMLLEMLGYSNLEELTGIHFSDLVSPEGRKEIRETCKKAIQSRKFPDHLEIPVIQRDGTLFYIDVTAVLILEEGKIVRVIGVSRDITGRKRMGEALRKSEALLSATERLSKVGGWEWDIEKKTMFCTDEVYRIHDLEPDEVIQDSAEFMAMSLQCYDPEERPAMEAAFRRCLEMGEPFDLEFPFTAVKGRRLYVRTTARPVFENEKIIKVVGNIMDVTERKQVERALRESEERFRAIFDHAAVGMALTSVSGHILKVNEAFCSFLGYSSEELENMHFSDVTHPQDLDMDVHLYRELVQGLRTSYMIDKRYVRKDGEIVWGRLGLSVIRDIDGSPEYSVGTCEDITNRKRTEDELKAAKEELEFRVQERTAELSRRADQLARLSSQLTLAEQRERRRIAEILHDYFQQLMVGAKIGQEFLISRMDGSLRPEAEHVLDLINQSIKKSRSLTHELSPAVLQSNNLSASLEWLAGWMQNTHGLEVELHIEEQVILDQKNIMLLLFQSVRELLFNVLKHSGARSATVQMEREKGELGIEVIDRGPGFDPQAVLSDTGYDQKFGLISIRERITHLGGRIEIESGPDTGTRISLVIPMKKEKPAESSLGDLHRRIFGKLIPLKTGTPKQMGKIGVMLVDDHPVMLEGMARFLNSCSDIEVVGEASDGEEAVHLVREIVPDIILMDIILPKMDGLEATRIIHSEFPHIRIIGLSVHDKQEGSAMIKAGACAYRCKSDDTDMILATIRDRDRGGRP